MSLPFAIIRMKGFAVRKYVLKIFEMFAKKWDCSPTTNFIKFQYSTFYITPHRNTRLPPSLPWLDERNRAQHGITDIPQYSWLAQTELVRWRGDGKALPPTRWLTYLRQTTTVRWRGDEKGQTTTLRQYNFIPLKFTE